ncbi:cyclin-like protein [Lophiostoma macrostomum CBS 122681]|uniref:Cyclin-like protein n=1 Tax=Lophiostoma macrostomum CBS 122681 TaxID=1314788 RepID=A0A6A6T1X4_9PLEO|nr:cyclin-like protein [Lophiostoma macrostomum CBS 122681]
MKFTEDDIYRLSSQYKNWSFTPSQLAATRLQTNIQATEHIKATIARQRAARALKADPEGISESERAGSSLDNGNATANGSGVSSGSGTPLRADKEVDCLTAAEEKKLVDIFCEKALELGKFLNFPIEVTATGIQFLRRFYLLNSPMTYFPQTISRSAMFIAAKCEDHRITAERYAESLPNTTPESILAPEYLITQALRFNFDVKHPFRGLKGGHLELMEMARGNAPAPPKSSASGPPRSASTLEQEMRRLPPPRKPHGAASNLSTASLEKRITDAYTHASHLLKTSALLTDVYLLYTPSHIWLAAHLLADDPLTTFYLGTKTPPATPLYAKILTTIRSCADMLAAHSSSSSSTRSAPHADPDPDPDEIPRLMKKLRNCRDPDRIDLVKLQEGKKRDALATAEQGADGAVRLEESKAKRRKVAREGFQKEADEFWGPALEAGKGEGEDEEGAGWDGKMEGGERGVEDKLVRQVAMRRDGG